MAQREEILLPLAPGGRLRRWWVDLSVRAKCLVVVAVPIIALACVCSAGLALGSIVGEQRRLAIQDRELTATAAQVLLDAVNAQGSIRGYAATGDSSFLTAYTASVERFPADRSTMLDAAARTGLEAEGDLVAATAVQLFAQLADIRTAVESDISDSDLARVLRDKKSTMDDLRVQVPALVDGPAASLIAARDRIESLQTKVDLLNEAGVGRARRSRAP